MSFDIELATSYTGYSITSARPDESVGISFCEFTSTEDGQHFIQRLEGIPNDILERIPSQTKPSKVDNMLAIFRRDGRATVYLNELELKIKIRVVKPVEAGAEVTKDDVADIESLSLGVQVPHDAGFLFIFSIGWRKGLFYDFGPICPDSQPRQYDISDVLGRSYCHVLFQERFSISEDEWKSLLEVKWFPFAGLKHTTIDALISHIRSGWDPDEKLDDIVFEVKNNIPQMLSNWKKKSSFIPHMEILERAVERFQHGDFMSCTALMIPRIEGILRTHHNRLESAISPNSKIKNDDLVDSSVKSKVENNRCLLLPHRFSSYLRKVYFASFKSDEQDIDISRHSVAHGVANPSRYDSKSAVISILIIHQLFYLFGNIQDENA